MKYKIKNMTFSPLRINDIRIIPKKIFIINEINQDLIMLEEKGLIKIKKIK